MSNSIKPFLDEHFLLQNKVAEELYHDFAKDLPIIDYHNHLSPKEVAENRQFDNITQVWLEGDHYKWRAMRANGISEDFITGNKSDEEKFSKWAETVPYTMRNPLYHWTHLELQRYFNITDILSQANGSAIYQQTNEYLKSSNYKTQGLLQQMNVETICTTDHPTDSLQYHIDYKANSNGFDMYPTFRPDKFLNIIHQEFEEYLQKLEQISNTSLSSFVDLVSALKDRIVAFHDVGCRLSDHGLAQLYDVEVTESQLQSIFTQRRNGQKITEEEGQQFQTGLLHILAQMYCDKGWVMQLHLGAIRNNNSRLLTNIGSDVGCDSIGDYEQGRGLSRFFNMLDANNKLAKTIIYNLNPRDNELFATMAGNFNDGEIIGKVQWGSAWWFLDQKDGIEKQIDVLSNMGLLSRFIGMLTDSRSFLSFPRHEYFRRILCNIIGQDVINGYLPNDVKWLGSMVKDICYKNAKQYFKFN